MKSHERDALITYLEFRLIGLVESVKDHADDDVVFQLYQEAYDVLNDLEDCFIVNEILTKGSSEETR